MTDAYMEARELLRLMPDEVRSVLEVKKYIEAIRAMRGDDEVAHSAEDDLRAGVLKAIAKGDCDDEPDELCAAVLETNNIKFNRWCA